jgi:MFS family permease
MRQLLSSKFWLSSAAKIRQLSTVYLPVLLLDLAYSSILTNTSFYTSYLGLSSTFLGVLMAVTTAFFAVLAIPFGRLSDRIDRRYALYAACLVLGAVSMGLPRCRNSMHLMLIFPGIGISMALFWPAYEAWLAEREGGGKLIQRVMLFNLFWSTGITLGPAFSSYLYGDANPFKPFYLAGVMVLLTLGTLIANSWQTSGVLKTDSASEANEESIETLYPPQPVRTSYLNIARCANFTSWFTLGVLRRLAPKLTKEMGMVPPTFGNLMLTLGGMQTMAFLILGSGYSTRWHYRFAPMLIVQLLAAFSFLGIWRLQHTLLWTLAFGVVGVSAAFTYFSSLYYGLDRHVDKGNKSGWHEAILGLGILLGPLLGGILADSRFGTQSPYLLCAGATVIAILVEIFIVSKMPKPSGDSL